MSLLYRLLVRRLIRRLLVRRMLAEIVLAPTLPELILALAALLVFLAAEVWSNFLGAVFKRLPVVGSTVASHVTSWIDSAEAELDTWLSELTGAMASLVTPVVLWPWYALYRLIEALTHIGTLARLGADQAATTAAQLPADLADVESKAIGAAESYTVATVQYAVTKINGDIAAVATDLSGAVASLTHDIQAVSATTTAEVENVGTALNSAVTSLTARITSVEQALSGDIGSVVQQIDTEILGVANQALTEAQAAQQTAIATASATAAALATTAVGSLDQAAHDLVIGPWAALLPALEVIAGALPEAVSEGLSLPGVIGGAVPVSIPGILAGTVAAVGAVAAEVEDCVVPNCGAMSQLGSLLNLLTDAAGLGVLLAFIEEAATNPARAVSDVESDLGALVSGTASAFRELIGL